MVVYHTTNNYNNESNNIHVQLLLFIEWLKVGAKKLDNSTFPHVQVLKLEEALKLEETAVRKLEKAKEATVKQQPQIQLEQMKKNRILCGVHSCHGQITPLFPGWRYPDNMTLYGMVCLWLTGSMIFKRKCATITSIPLNSQPHMFNILTQKQGN